MTVRRVISQLAGTSMTRNSQNVGSGSRHGGRSHGGTGTGLGIRDGGRHDLGNVENRVCRRRDSRLPLPVGEAPLPLAIWLGANLAKRLAPSLAP